MRDPKPAARAHPSRRAVIATACAGSLPLIASHPVQTEPAMLLCKRWLALDGESYRLMRRWSRLESFLVEHHGWFRLSEDQQRALPEASELYGIDARLTSVFEERNGILRQLPALKAQSRETAMLKLEVAAAVVELEGRDEAYRLLRSATRDLRSL